ncbi:MAG TPA: BadF/BadG/BcrA/BcrD ATPase family protein [Clostridia bacterium]|nr:BadF/BadG/BcrA/BcrD ATPase family protein [Clostridia bacterium]
MDFFLAVDGGGSKTVFALHDASGALLALLEAGPSAYCDLGVPEAARVLLEGARDLFARAGASPKDLRAAAFCLASVGENAGEDRALARLIGTLCERTRVVNDSVGALYAAHAGKPGIALVSGTGSIACGMGEDGEIARCGGYSPSFSDEGSSYRIALEAMGVYCKQDDGRLPRGPLHALFGRELGVDSAFSLMDWEARNRASGRKGIALLQPLAARAAREGDQAAAALYARAAEELAALALGVRGKLRFASASVPVACAGGTFRVGALLTGPLSRALAAGGCALVPPLLSAPVKGAAVLSLKTGNIPISEEILSNLRKN